MRGVFPGGNVFEKNGGRAVLKKESGLGGENRGTPRNKLLTGETKGGTHHLHREFSADKCGKEGSLRKRGGKRHRRGGDLLFLGLPRSRKHTGHKITV